MEPEIVEDKKLAKPCACGHSAAQHDADGAGHCLARGCGCLGLPLAEGTAVDEPDDERPAPSPPVLPVELDRP